MVNIPPLLDWPTDAGTAIAAQNRLSGSVFTQDRFGDLLTVAGIDCSYDVTNNLSFAIVVVIRLNDLKPLQTVRATLPTEFPYIPGLLSFREIPVVLAALRQLTALPDLLMVDGQGVAHPRRLGIAAHLGALLDWPTIGVAKSLLCGRYDEPGLHKGDRSPLVHKGERIGTVLRSKDGVKPLFVSPGHRVAQDTTVELVMRCLIKHRLPEPTRIADKVSKDKENLSLSIKLAKRLSFFAK